MRAKFVLTIACLELAACGSSENDDDQSTGGASSGGTSTGATSSGGASSGGASNGGTSSGGSSTGGSSNGGSSTGGTSGGGTGAGGASGGSPGGGGTGGSAVPPILSVDFDKSPVGSYSKAAFDADWPSADWVSGLGTGRADIVSGANAYSGNSLCVKYPKGTFGPDTQAIQFQIDLGASYPELFVMYRIRFGAGFDFVKGGKLPGLFGGKGNTGGDKPTGSDGWSGRMMWRSGGDAVQYVYHPDQPTIYGEDFPWNVGGDHAFSPGVWHTLEHRVVMNTPAQKDGSVSGWWSGALALDVKGLRFRDVSSFSIDGFYFSTFFGGSDATWAASKDETICFDDFMISTAPLTH